MKSQNELQIIEDKYPVSEASSHNFKLWPLLRQKIYITLFTKKTDSKLVFRTRNKIQLIKNLIKGFKYNFQLRKFDFVFFNNADKRSFLRQGKHFDVFFDAWADRLNQDNSLFIEWAIEKHYPKSMTYSKHVMSDLFYKTLCKIIAFFVIVEKTKFEKLEQILIDYNLSIDLKNVTKYKIAEILFYKKLFKWINPKGIFLISSFTKEPIVIAANVLGIKVYEAQHGYIGPNHQFYNSQSEFSKIYYPDFLISFGEYEKMHPPKGFIFSPEQIISVGSLYLEDIRVNYKNKELESLKSIYSKVFCVTLQTVLDNELIEWVHRQCDIYKDCIFILVPRDNRIDYTWYQNPRNCKIFNNLNIYQILKYSDYNITMYSTTAMEAPVFNTYNIFYNLKGLSRKYFNEKDIFGVFINENEDINNSHLKVRQDVKPTYFINDYFKNVENANLYF